MQVFRDDCHLDLETLKNIEIHLWFDSRRLFSSAGHAVGSIPGDAKGHSFSPRVDNNPSVCTTLSRGLKPRPLAIRVRPPFDALGIVL